MQKYLIATALVLAAATPALAAEHFAVIDTVGNCAVVELQAEPV